MRLLAILASLIFLALPSVSAAQSKYPAGKVVFSDADTLQEKFDGGDLGGGGAASSVSFVNTVTGFVATQVQDAIDELYTWVAPYIGWARVVHNDAEIESYYRSLDTTISDTDQPNSHVILADDFVVDPTSTSPLLFNLPVGGAETTLHRIDLNGNTIIRRVDPTGGGDWDGCVVSVNFGNPAGTCGTTPPGFYADEEGCQGVSHDSETYVYDGAVTNDSPACDGTPTADCGRKAICFNNERLRFGTAGSPGGKYATRNYVRNVKTGFNSEIAGGTTISPTMQLPKDVSIKTGVMTSLLGVLGSMQMDTTYGVEITPDADGLDSWSGQIHFENARHYNFSTVDEEGGLLRILAGADVGGPSTPGTVTGRVHLNNSTLGKTIGGNFDLSITGEYDAGTANCSGSGNTDHFLDAGTDATEAISGVFRRTGNFCTRDFLRAGSINNIAVYDNIPDNGAGIMGSLASDTQIGAGVRHGLFNVAPTGTIGTAYYRVTMGRAHRAVFDDIADIGDIADSRATDGSGMLDAKSVYELDFGPDGFYRVTGTAPTIETSRYPDRRAVSGNGPYVITGSGALPGPVLTVPFADGSGNLNTFGSGVLISDVMETTKAGEISGLTEKVTPAADDWLVIEDSAAANVKKKTRAGNLPSAGGAPTSATYLTSGPETGTLPNSTQVNDLAALNSLLGSAIADGPHTTDAAALTSGFIPAARVDAAHIDALSEVATALKSGGGTGNFFVTGSWALPGTALGVCFNDGTGKVNCNTTFATYELMVTKQANTLTAAGSINAAAGAVRLPQGTSCSGVITEGSVCWETGNDRLFVGTAAAALRMQGWDADLDTIAALTPSAGAVMFGNGSAWAADLTPAIVGTDFTGTAASLTAGAATALAANPSNCSAGSAPRGVAASGAAEDCTDYLEPTDVPNVTVGDTVCASLTTCTQGSIHFDTTPAGTVTPCYCVAADTWEPGT